MCRHRGRRAPPGEGAGDDAIEDPVRQRSAHARHAHRDPRRHALTALAAAVRFGSTPRVVVVPLLSAAVLLALGGYLCWTFYTSADNFEIARTTAGYFVTGSGTDPDAVPLTV